MIEGLEPRTTPGATVQETGPDSWRMNIPAGPSGSYRLSQMDDYKKRRRGEFRWSPPLSLELEARSAAPILPGTWGFGLWNDPFSLSLGLGGATRRIPALPNTAWFFFASAPNYLALRDDLPAVGALAATFRSPAPQWPWILSGIPALPLLLLPVTARLIRGLTRSVIRQDAMDLPSGPGPQPSAESPTSWRAYQMTWLEDRVTFQVDGRTVLETGVAPRAPLGLVIWIDNQYAAFPPDGRLAYGTLENPQDAWIEIRGLTVGTL